MQLTAAHSDRAPETYILKAKTQGKREKSAVYTAFGIAYAGAGRGSRTLTVSLPPDFESGASANFAIPATRVL